MQNDLNLTLTAAQLTAIDAAITALETAVQGFPVLSPADKANHVKAPDNSRGWMEGMLTRAQQNLNHLPRDFDPALVQADLVIEPTLDPRILRLQRVLERMTDATFLGNSDAFAALLEARRRLVDAKVTGVDDNLNEGMERFFNRPKRTTKPTT